METALFSLKGKKAMVTGGAVGIGRACATELAMGGADVAIVGRTRGRGEKTCRMLRRMGVDSFFVQCDVSDSDQISAMTEAVARRLGQINIAVNNAGSGIIRDALSVSRDEWDHMINLNLAGVFWCAQAQARQMVAQRGGGGKIINIASMYSR